MTRSSTALAQAEIPPLLAALAYVTGDLSLLRDELRPDPTLLALPQGGLSEEQQTDGSRAGARGAHPIPRRRRSSGIAALRRRTRTHHGVRRRRVRHDRVRAVARGGTGAARRRSTRTELAQGRHRPRHGLPRRHHRRGHVRPARRPPSPDRRRRLRRAREERRGRRHLVREQLSGLSRRQSEPQLQLFLRAAPRLAVPLLVARRAARLLPSMRERLRLA